MSLFRGRSLSFLLETVLPPPKSQRLYFPGQSDLFVATCKVTFLIFKTPSVTFGNYRLFLSAFSRVLLREVKSTRKRLSCFALLPVRPFLSFLFAVPPLSFTGAQRKEMWQAVLGV